MAAVQAPDPEGVITRMDSEEMREAVSTKLLSLSGNAHKDMITAFATAYRQHILSEYEALASLHNSHFSQWPGYQQILTKKAELEDDLWLPALRLGCNTGQARTAYDTLDIAVSAVVRKLERFQKAAQDFVQQGGLAPNGGGNSYTPSIIAQKKLKVSDGIKFNDDGTVIIEDFLRAAHKQFVAADNNATVKLEHSDKINHVNQLLQGAADKALQTETLRAERSNTLPTTWNYPDSTDDYAHWLKTVVFGDKLRVNKIRTSYNEECARGFHTEPDKMVRTRIRLREEIGQSSDNRVSSTQLLQDYLKVLPQDYLEKIFQDDKYKDYTQRNKLDNNGIPDPAKQEQDDLLALDRAAVISTDQYKIFRHIALSGAPADGRQRRGYAAVLDNLAADDDVRLAALRDIDNTPADAPITLAMVDERINNHIAAAFSSSVSPRLGEGYTPAAMAQDNFDNLDADDIRAISDYNALIALGNPRDVAYSLAQREYNKSKRIELAQQTRAPSGTAGGHDMEKIRCWACGKFGHMAADCPAPPRDRSTPFRRLRRRPPMRGRRGMQPDRINVRLFRKERNRFTRIEDHEDLNAIDFANDYIYAAEEGTDESRLESLFIIV